MGKTLFLVGLVGALAVGIDEYPIIGLGFCVLCLVGLHWPFNN